MPSKTWRGISDAQVGAGLLAEAVVQSAHVSLTYRFREQARSHNSTAFSCQHRSAWLFCGSWLACDAGTSVCQVHWVDAIAGKPAPTFDRVQTSSTPLPDALRSNCGSGLAREGGGSVSSCVTDIPLSRASPLPQVDRLQLQAPHCLAFLWELACLRCRHLGVSGTPG